MGLRVATTVVCALLCVTVACLSEERDLQANSEENLGAWRTRSTKAAAARDSRAGLTEPGILSRAGASSDSKAPSLIWRERPQPWVERLFPAAADIADGIHHVTSSDFCSGSVEPASMKSLQDTSPPLQGGERGNQQTLEIPVFVLSAPHRADRRRHMRCLLNDIGFTNITFPEVYTPQNITLEVRRHTEMSRLDANMVRNL